MPVCFYSCAALFVPKQAENFDDLLEESEQMAQRRNEAAEMLEVGAVKLARHALFDDLHCPSRATQTIEKEMGMSCYPAFGHRIPAVRC